MMTQPHIAPILRSLSAKAVRRFEEEYVVYETRQEQRKQQGFDVFAWSKTQCVQTKLLKEIARDELEGIEVREVTDEKLQEVLEFYREPRGGG
jgi:hypothetical protein